MLPHWQSVKYEITTLPLARVFVFQIFSRVETILESELRQCLFVMFYINTSDIVPTIDRNRWQDDLVPFYLSGTYNLPSTVYPENCYKNLNSSNVFVYSIISFKL